METQFLSGKVALITGSTRGIGRAISRELSRRGSSVALNYCSRDETAHELLDLVRSEGGSAQLFKADIGRVAAVEKLFEAVVERFGGLDILVNNAGIMENKPLEEVTESEFDRVFNTNVKGLFFCCQEAAKIMRSGGRIINIGTSVTKVMLPNYGTYAASKGAVEQITRVLAKELGAKNITVNTVSPGPTDTILFRKGKTEEQIASLAAMSSFNRLGTPEDIAAIVALLCSNDSAWVSGQNIFANGAFIG